jgi:riboflavin kinase / FMN adenylyltransferase
VKFTANVIKGKGRGKELGFPTLNLKIPKNIALKFGIYACWIHLLNKKYQGAVHYGPVPAFSDPKPSLEVFVLNFQSNVSVSRLTIQPIKYLRPIKFFSTIALLKKQMTHDVAKVKKILTPLHP